MLTVDLIYLQSNSGWCINFESEYIKTSRVGYGCNRIFYDGATRFLFSWKFSVFIVQFGFYFLIWSRDRDIFPQFQSAISGVGKPDIVG
jgi:hypothetical protein